MEATMGGRQKSTTEQAARAGVGVASTGSRLAGIAAGPYLGPLSMANGGLTMGEAAADMSENGVTAGNTWDMTRGAGGVLSGTAGATGAVGTALAAGGGYSAGATVGTAFGASALGTAGAVAGAGLAGYGVGTLINEATTSDYARRSYYGQDDSGRDRTLNDVVIDTAVGVDSWLDEATGIDAIGDIVGGVTAAGGAILAAPQGLRDSAAGLMGSWFE
jgi:hypothetical protein